MKSLHSATSDRFGLDVALSRWPLLVLSVLLMSAVALCQNLGPYTFTLIDSGTDFDLVVGNVNNDGVVTFNRFENGTENVYVSDGGPKTQISRP